MALHGLLIEIAAHATIAIGLLAIVYLTAIRHTTNRFWWVAYGAMFGACVAALVSFGLCLGGGGWGPPAMPMFIVCGITMGGIAGFSLAT